MNEKTADFEFPHLEKIYSEEGFWDKIRSIAKKADGKVIYTALELYYATHSSYTPLWAGSFIAGALGYLILPNDFFPDILPGIGFTDDLAMMTAVLSVIAADIKDDVKAKARSKMKEWFGEDSIEAAGNNVDGQ